MIIIDEQADHKLVQTLLSVRQQPADMSCVHYKFSTDAERQRLGASLRDAMIEGAQRHVSGAAHSLFFCDDGDVFVLMQGAEGRQARKMMVEVAEWMRLPANDDVMSLYDMAFYVNKLLVQLEAKIEHQRKLAREKEQHSVVQKAAQRKHALLENLSKQVTVTAAEIDTRRRARDAIELLIIEDDPFSRKLVENVLHKMYRLTALPSAEYALATYARLAPDVVFLDIQLPDVTGHELLERFMAMDPNAYIVMLSGNADSKNISQAMALGAKGFMAKPFTREKLFQYIERCPTYRK